MRLFVAVHLPEEVLDRVAEVAAAVPGIPGVRPTTRDQWHVTLRFLGEVDDPEPVVEALERADLEPAEAVLGPEVSLLARKVLCLPVDGLGDLASVVVAATADLGTPADDRPFRGHLTLARLKKGTRPRVVRHLVGTPLAGQWPVSEIALVRSHLSSQGSTYDTLHTRQLA